MYFISLIHETNSNKINIVNNSTISNPTILNSSLF